MSRILIIGRITFDVYAKFNGGLNPKQSFTKDINKQIQYMAWVYDYNSPAVKEFSDITRRKDWAKATVSLTIAVLTHDAPRASYLD